MKKLAALALGTLTLSAAVTPSRGILKHRERGGIGYDTGYTTAEFFLASKWKNGFMPYADFRGHAFDDGRFATNAGLGLRYNWSQYTFGGNFYYDYREAKNLQPHQLAGGLEFLSTDYDIRLNGYGPIADTTVEKEARFVKFQGNSAIFKRRFKAALPMIEGEFGMPIGSRCNTANLYGAIGPYYLFQKKVSGSRLGDAVGGQARILLDAAQLFNFQFNVSYDKIYKWILQGTGGISIPLGKSKNFSKNRSFLCEARNQLPYRKEIIPIECKNKRVTSSSRILFVDNTSSSNGTFESPYPTTALAMANSRPGDIIYIFPGDGTTTGYNTPLTLLNNQTIQGSGVKLDLGNGLVVPAQTSQFPKLTSGSDTITVSINSVVKGLNLSATGQGIRSDEPTAGLGGINRIENNFIHNCDFGCFVGNTSNSVQYLIANNTVRQCAESGIQVEATGATVTSVIANNSIRNITDSNLPYNTIGNCIHINPGDTTVVGTAILSNDTMTAANGIFYSPTQSSVSNLIVKGNTANNITVNDFFAKAENTSVSSITIQNNRFGATLSADSGPIYIETTDSAEASALIKGNDCADAGEPTVGIIEFSPKSTSSQKIILERNVIHGQGIGIFTGKVSFATNFSLTLDNNLIYDTSEGGINCDDITITNDFTYTVRNNRLINIGTQPISMPSINPGVTMNANIINNVLFGTNANAISLRGNTGDVCATVIGNQTPGQGLQLQQTNPSVFNIQTTTPGSPEGLLELNDFTAVNPTGTINYVSFGTCP